MARPQPWADSTEATKVGYVPTEMGGSSWIAAVWVEGNPMFSTSSTGIKVMMSTVMKVSSDVHCFRDSAYWPSLAEHRETLEFVMVHASAHQTLHYDIYPCDTDTAPSAQLFLLEWHSPASIANTQHLFHVQEAQRVQTRVSAKQAWPVTCLRISLCGTDFSNLDREMS